MFIVLGHSIRSTSSLIISEYHNMKVVFLPDTSISLSSLQLGAMYEFHALYKTVVVHNSMEHSEAISIELPSENVTALHYVLYAWRSVSDLAVVNMWLVTILASAPIGRPDIFNVRVMASVAASAHTEFSGYSKKTLNII